MNKNGMKEQEFLSPNEMKLVRGGALVPTGCEGKSKEKCSGDCLGDGSHIGSCGWSEGIYNRCTCAFVTLG